jgi:hypothetical protein
VNSAKVGHLLTVPNRLKLKALFGRDYKLDYSQIIIQIIYTHQIYAKSCSALGHIHILLNQTSHYVHFAPT